MTHQTSYFSKQKAFFCGLFFVVLSGCSTSPQVIGKFQSLKTVQESTDNLHIILVHGISTHQPGWSNDFSQKLAASLNLQTITDDNWGKCIVIPGNGEFEMCRDTQVIPQAVDGVVKFVAMQSPDKKKLVTITEVTWSPITTRLKEKLLEYDKQPMLSDKRAWLNKSLKEKLVDDALSDALAYVGKSGEQIRKVVWQAICYSMSGKLSNDETCDVVQDNHRFAFITHSLGSRIVFDVLHPDNVVTAPKQSMAITKVVSNTAALYMLANQLPLLDMANEADKSFTAAGSGNQGSAYSSLGRFLRDRKPAKVVSQGIGVNQNLPISIAAFSDPNDILSYSLCRSNMPELHDVDNVADVWIRNTPNLILIANPLKAHNGYWGDDVIKLLTGNNVVGKQLCCEK